MEPIIVNENIRMLGKVIGLYRSLRSLIAYNKKENPCITRGFLLFLFVYLFDMPFLFDDLIDHSLM